MNKLHNQKNKYSLASVQNNVISLIGNPISIALSTFIEKKDVSTQTNDNKNLEYCLQCTYCEKCSQYYLIKSHTYIHDDFILIN